MDLKTTYLGLPLRNPLIVGASSLTLDAEKVQRCEQAGAGAVVLKSLFEEQIRHDFRGQENAAALDAAHAEAFAYMEADIGMRYGPREYLEVIRRCKDAVGIPVIASINCVSAEWWADFAQQVQAAGADALELNISIMPESLETSGSVLEERYEQIVAAARAAVTIPIAVKLGPWFTSIPHIALRLARAGASGLVLFNRFYRPTIDIERLTVVAGARFSTPAELSPALRWISFLADRVSADLIGATGVHGGADLARVLLAGGRAAQVVSVLYQEGLDAIGRILDELADWMARKEFEQIEDFRGLLSRRQNPHTDLFGRLQYIKGLVGIE